MKEDPSHLSPEDLAKARRIAYLVAGFISQRLTTQEHDELDSWIAESDDNVLLFEEMIDKRTLAAMTEKVRQIDADTALEKIKQKIDFKPHQRKTGLRRLLQFAVAASILGVISFILFNRNHEHNTSTKPSFIVSNDFAPGTNKATLTLANGSTIILESVRNGELANQGKIKVMKTDSTQLSYFPSTAGNQPEAYNTLTTPKGGQFQLVLSDGTHIWLNSQSSIRYPIVFSAGERTVELKGEGYFEVTKNAQKPFHVRVGDADVKVLGTHFNINAYEDENELRATLLEGLINISKNGQSMTIRPGEQAEISEDATTIKLNIGVNLDQVVAWKNGFFQFDKTDLKVIMRQLSRWYNVDITYETKEIERTMTGKISRNSNASQVLDMLEYTGLHFNIENNKIVVAQ
jgi:transmembrane sensor